MVVYEILIKTGFRFEGWTRDDVFIRLYGRNDEITEKNLRDLDRIAFTRGSTHTFTFETDVNIGDHARIALWRDGYWFTCWYIDWIQITPAGGNASIFPVQKWIKQKREYFFNHIDTCLPQQDRYREMRQDELRIIQNEYQLEVKEPGLPAQVKELPDDETFSFQESAILGLENKIYELEKTKLLRGSKGNASLRGCEITWKSFNDVRTVYSKKFGTPRGSEYFNDDESFGRQRLNGLNPCLIKICNRIPDNFNVNEENIREQLGDTPLDVAIREGSIFIIDLEILSHCRPLPGCEMTCPLALFHYEEETGRLMPIAIQLFQEPSETNPVFYPSDPEYTWMLAKMWYSLADSTYHQALTHLNFTHLMMEGISVSAKRQLAPSHPIMRLINPHFLYLMAINSLALDKLINVGGFIDRTSNAGLEGHFDIMRKSMEWWRLDQHGNLRTNLQIRGVFDNDSLGDSYYFRDDALLLYDAIELYVRDYVGLYYTNNQLLVNDNEIQSWGTEMVTTRDQGGLGILGVPNNGNFENSEQLVETLTPIIYMCSVGHAAANFQQYDEYGSPFNYPYSLSGKPPQDKTPVTEKTILNTIANKAQLLELMSITKILSDKTTQSLGDFEENLIVDPPAVEIVTNFQTNLANVGRQIDNANRERRHPYMWLHPEHIPNAISI